MEVRAPPAAPTQRTSQLDAPEQQAFSASGVDVAELQSYLRANNLALTISRNVTARQDAADRQQPFNLQVLTNDNLTGTKTIGATGDGI